MGISARRTKKGFRLLEERWTPVHSIKTVPREAYRVLGFRTDMSFDEAKARATQINQQNQLEVKTKIASIRRVEQSKLVQTAYLPELLVKQFEAELRRIYVGDDAKDVEPYRYKIIMRFWNAAKLLIATLEIDPKDFRAENTRMFSYFKKKKWSRDYINRIIRMLDRWGDFSARKYGTSYDRISKLTSIQSEQLAKQRDALGGVRVPALPLTWKALSAAKDKFQSEGLDAQWNWLYIALWFGLRPLEVDGLRNKENTKLTYHGEQKVDLLEVYQTKLINIPRERRWKIIPVFFKEQVLAIEIYKSGKFKRPLNKTLRRLIGNGIETYSPRKGFVDLMLERGYAFEDISTFMGHQNIQQTWSAYKSRRRFKLPKSG